MIPWIIISVAVLLILILIATIYLFKKGKLEHTTDYRGFFIIGLGLLVIGLVNKNPPLWIIGLSWIAIGLVNKNKWGKFKRWKQLSKKEKKFKMGIIIALGVLALLGLALFLIQYFKVLNL